MNLKEAFPAIDTNEVSDGYHTFGELYEHRITIYIALCKQLATSQYLVDDIRKSHYVWVTKKHSDGSSWDGWFVLGIDEAPGSQITYHLPMSKWDECAAFADEIEKAPDWDGHTSQDVLTRLNNLI